MLPRKVGRTSSTFISVGNFYLRRKLLNINEKSSKSIYGVLLPHHSTDSILTMYTWQTASKIIFLSNNRRIHQAFLFPCPNLIMFIPGEKWESTGGCNNLWWIFNTVWLSFYFMFVCLYFCMCTLVQVPVEASRCCQIPWIWAYRHLWASWCLEQDPSQL